MHKKLSRSEARELVWNKLRKVAKPDSRFGWNFVEFNADYEGSEICADRIRDHELYANSKVIFVAPDNNLEKLREYAIIDKKVLLMANYGITRGFFLLSPGSIPTGKEELAATLDGFEKFNEHISLKKIKEEFGKIDMLVTGASVIATSGFRFGKGHGLFDLEWGMFWETGLVAKDTPIFVAGHDCQVVDTDIEPSSYDTIVDYIVTPTFIKKIDSNYPKPSKGVIWEIMEKGMIATVPPLKKLFEQRKHS